MIYMRLDRIPDEKYKPSPGRDKKGYWITSSKEYKAMMKQLKAEMKTFRNGKK